MSGKGKKAAAGAAAPKARSISSFFAPAPKPVAPPPSEAEKEPEPPIELDDDDDEPSPAKRPRVSSPLASPPFSPPPPSAGTATPSQPLPLPESDPALHARFLRRLGPGVASVSTAHGERRDALAAAAWPGAYGRDAGPAGKYTPFEAQIVALKRAHPGVLLLVGYKFKCFGDDAPVAAAVLNLFCFADRNFLTAGGPVHRGPLYVKRLVEAGHKVGVARQVETAALKAAGETAGGKSGVFQRRVTAVYTRATLAAGAAMDGGEALAGVADGSPGGSYLVALAEGPGTGGGAELAVVGVDPATGDVVAGTVRDGPLRAGLEAHLLALQPVELLSAGGLSGPTEKLVAGMLASLGARREDISTDGLLHGGAAAELRAGMAPSDAAALEALPDLLAVALAAAARHLQAYGLAAPLRRVVAFRPLECAQAMALPPNALRQLEVLAPTGGATGASGSLLWLLQGSSTAGGGRCVRRWVAAPLRQRAAIEARLEAVAALLAAGSGTGWYDRLGAALHKLPDVERVLARSLHRTATPAEFCAGLAALAAACDKLSGGADSAEAMDTEGDEPASSLLRRLLAAAGDAGAVAAARRLVARLSPEAAAARPMALGALFLEDDAGSTGCPALDAARAATAAAEAALDGLLPALRKQLRLPRLEYVRVAEVEFLLEVPEGCPVPEGWLKHSSLKGKKLGRWQAPAVLTAVATLERSRERLTAAGRAAWDAHLASFAAAYGPLRAAADALAQLDALRALAALSGNPNYCRPVLLPDDAPPAVRITAGRHPQLDALLAGGFVANDTALCGAGVRCLVVTGPNMGGKSVYMRQTALIVLLAHLGCYVPAAAAELSVFDGIHTRMGASDSLATGASTFLEEMAETAAILRAATPRSLVILDELGRGTATADGLAIAGATAEHLAAAGPLTLFVTHFPSIARELAAAHPGRCAAAYVSYAAAGGAGRDAAVTFLYKLVPGVSPSSFGLNVARLAGLPPGVVTLAKAKADEAAEEAEARRALAPLGEELGVLLHAAAAAAAAEDPDALVALQGRILAALAAGVA